MGKGFKENQPQGDLQLVIESVNIVERRNRACSWGARLQSKTTSFFAVNGKGEQRTFCDGGEVVCVGILGTILLFNQFQGFAQLQHSSEFVLAGAGTGTIAD